jgi:alpha-L-fucosidase 2
VFHQNTDLWEHYLYTMDKDFLEDLYPVIKGSVEFFMDFLVEHPNGKWLITNPSTSPGNTPNDSASEVFFDPCKSVLEQRGDGGTGFSRAWKMALWARLYDGERGLKIFKGYLKEQACPQLFAKCFSTPQVDGTFGVGAGITEMIMQSHEGVIDLLPALPVEWNNGSFEGVCARGGFELDIQWEQGVVTETRILSHSGEKCRIDPGVKASLTHEGKKVSFKKQKDGSIEFDTKEGETYLISSKK